MSIVFTAILPNPSHSSHSTALSIGEDATLEAVEDALVTPVGIRRLEPLHAAILVELVHRIQELVIHTHVPLGGFDGGDSLPYFREDRVHFGGALWGGVHGRVEGVGENLQSDELLVEWKEIETDLIKKTLVHGGADVLIQRLHQCLQIPRLYAALARLLVGAAFRDWATARVVWGEVTRAPLRGVEKDEALAGFGNAFCNCWAEEFCVSHNWCGVLLSLIA